LRHPPHYDRQSFVTVVVSLNQYNVDFSGGLYVRTSPGTEQFVASELGDAVVHQHDLEHGVWVQQGERYSWILWLQDAAECRVNSNAEWFLKDSYKSDPVAMYQLADVLSGGPEQHDPRIREASTAILKKSALLGYARAQFKLGTAYASGRGVPKDDAAALGWYEAAARQNFSNGAYNLANMLYEGQGVQKDLASAEAWYERCLSGGFERNPSALNNLANLLFYSAPRRPIHAIQLWEEAAETGFPIAADNLAQVFELAAAGALPSSEDKGFLGHSDSDSIASYERKARAWRIIAIQLEPEHVSGESL
jgi:TPR repeat protein